MHVCIDSTCLPHTACRLRLYYYTRSKEQNRTLTLLFMFLSSKYIQVRVPVNHMKRSCVCTLKAAKTFPIPCITLFPLRCGPLHENVGCVAIMDGFLAPKNSIAGDAWLPSWLCGFEMCRNVKTGEGSIRLCHVARLMLKNRVARLISFIRSQ